MHYEILVVVLLPCRVLAKLFVPLSGYVTQPRRKYDSIAEVFICNLQAHDML